MTEGRRAGEIPRETPSGDQLRELEAELRLARTIVENAADAIFHLDPEGRTTFANPEAALTLAAHELATNAAKYGALSRDGGSVSCTWTVGPAEPRRRIEILWTEAGGPPVQAPQQRGFGSRMIERALAIELAGEARLEFAPEGLRCVIVGVLPEDGASQVAP